MRHFWKNTRQKISRIQVISHEEPLKISENTNAAIQAATGEYLVFADHDDVLTPNALVFECAKAMNEHPETDVLHSDEDKMTMDGNKFFQPHMKPDFNPGSSLHRELHLPFVCDKTDTDGRKSRISASGV